MKRKETEKLDVTKYVGTKADIVKAEIIETKYGMALHIQTEPIDLKDGDKLPDGKKLSASIMLSFMEKDGDQFVGINTKMDKFLQAKGVDPEKDLPDKFEIGDEVKKLLGVKVVCQKNMNGFLEIA